MSTSKEDLELWFRDGVAGGASYMLVVCDTFDHEDYPVYCLTSTSAKEKERNLGSMQRLMECYNLTKPMAPQMALPRVYDFGD